MTQRINFTGEEVRKALTAPTPLQRHDALIALGMDEWQVTVVLRAWNFSDSTLKKYLSENGGDDK